MHIFARLTCMFFYLSQLQEDEGDEEQGHQLVSYAELHQKLSLMHAVGEEKEASKWQKMQAESEANVEKLNKANLGVEQLKNQLEKAGSIVAR